MIRFNSFNYGSLFGFGSGNSLYSNLSKLSGVRSGTYAKALKSYYGRNNQTASVQKKSSVSKYNNSIYAQQSGLSNVSKESTALSETAKKLTDAGKDGLFASEEKYDADAAYRAANDLVTDYNDTLDAVNKTTNLAVNSAAESMTRMTGVMNKSLSGIGITVGQDGRMSINEEEFKNAGFDKVKSMLGTNGSFVRIIGSSAQRLGLAADQQNRQLSVESTGLYGRYGSYFGNNGFGGSWFNGLF
ncbi:MAG: hypothetical protein K6B28_03660 [Lachnospiraceae bacterium]|nr:hypothetical protein [Lachnospiraceae bacterium]